jgi:hypothetical protein
MIPCGTIQSLNQQKITNQNTKKVLKHIIPGETFRDCYKFLRKRYQNKT